MSDSRAPELALVVTAGGPSRRMGMNKALLTGPGGEALVAHVIRRLQPLASAGTVVVANDPAVVAALPAGVQVVADAWPGGGALGGLATGLAHCSGWAMAVACDMPFVSAALFARLVELAAVPHWDVIAPVAQGHIQVFHALYHRRSLPAMVAQLAAGRLAVLAALDLLRVRLVDESELAGVAGLSAAFVNVNTPAEWAAARRRMGAPSA